MKKEELDRGNEIQKKIDQIETWLKTINIVKDKIDEGQGACISIFDESGRFGLSLGEGDIEGISLEYTLLMERTLKREKRDLEREFRLL